MYCVVWPLEQLQSEKQMLILDTKLILGRVGYSALCV